MPSPAPPSPRVGFAGSPKPGSPEWSVRLAPTCIVIIACGLMACGAASNREAPIDRAVLLVHEAHARQMAADELRCTEEPLRVQRLHSHTVRTCIESSMRSGRHVETGDLMADLVAGGWEECHRWEDIEEPTPDETTIHRVEGCGAHLDVWCIQPCGGTKWDCFPAYMYGRIHYNCRDHWD